MATLYATHGGFGATDTGLWIIDPTDMSGTLVGDTSPPGSDYFFTGLAFDPTDDTLYGVTGGLGNNTRFLFTIDKLTGEATVVGGMSGATIADITFDASGQLYGFKVSNRRLCTIDKATGAVAEVGVSGLGSSSGNGLAVDPNDDNLIWLFPSGSSGEPWFINKTTGAATSSGGTFFPHLGADTATVGAAAFGPSDVLYGVATAAPSTLFTVGAPNEDDEYPLTSLGHFPDDDDSPWDAIAWFGTGGPPPDPPEPTPEAAQVVQKFIFGAGLKVTDQGDGVILVELDIA